MKNLNTQIVLLALLFVGLSAKAIVKGRDANLAESASTLSLQIGAHERGCTGVVISSQLIMTAGHCFDNVSSSLSSVYVGNGKNGAGLKRLNIERWQRHPLYREPTASGRKEPADIQYDIAFIKSKENILTLLKISESQLPMLFRSTAEMAAFLDAQTVKQTQADGKTVIVQNPWGIVYGYGHHKLGQSADEDPRKKELTVTIMQSPANNILITRSLEAKRGQCEGDSGGGLFIKTTTHTYLLGILSGINSSVACGKKDSFAAYVKMTENICWVLRSSGLASSHVSCAP